MPPLIDQINEAINQAAEKYQESAQGYDVLDEAFKDGADFLMPIVKKLIEQRDESIKAFFVNESDGLGDVLNGDNLELIKLLKEQAK